MTKKDAVPATDPNEVISETTISLGDITAVIQIIDVVTKRGAFNGEELGDVGAVRNRLKAFIVAATPAAAEPTKEAIAETPTA